MEQYGERAVEPARRYLPKLALALFTLIIGLWFSRAMVSLTEKTFAKSIADQILAPFIPSLGLILFCHRKLAVDSGCRKNLFPRRLLGHFCFTLSEKQPQE